MEQERIHTAPTPRIFYIHDDLSEDVRRRYGPDSPAARLTRELFAAVRRDPGRVIVLTLEEQLAALIAQGPHAPFETALGIARAGERVARQLHERTGWLPAIRRVSVTREEDGRGGYNLVSTAAEPLAAQLGGLGRCASLAVVDDTVFSGLTMRTILQALPAALRARTHAFCLRAVAETLPDIRALCAITAGFAAPGRILDEVSFINASGLVMRVGIRRIGQQPLAFFERPEWMRAWFPGYGEEVTDVCRLLNAVLESDPPASP